MNWKYLAKIVNLTPFRKRFVFFSVRRRFILVRATVRENSRYQAKIVILSPLGQSFVVLSVTRRFIVDKTTFLSELEVAKETRYFKSVFTNIIPVSLVRRAIHAVNSVYKKVSVF